MNQNLSDILLPGINPDTLNDQEPLPIGTPVEIVRPGMYYNVKVGMKGIIEYIFVGGYGVRVTVAGNRVLWFRRNSLKKEGQRGQ